MIHGVNKDLYGVRGLELGVWVWGWDDLFVRTDEAYRHSEGLYMTKLDGHVYCRIYQPIHRNYHVGYV